MLIPDAKVGHFVPSLAFFCLLLVWLSTFPSRLCVALQARESKGVGVRLNTALMSDDVNLGSC